MKTSKWTSTIALLSIAALAPLGFAQESSPNGKDSGGAVFTSSNTSLANTVVAFRRNGSGALVPIAAYYTGGTGNDMGLGSQNAVVMTENRQWLLTVNAGSNDISVFRVHGWGLELSSRTQSGGSTPISLTVHGNVVYVLNAGSGNNITGFRLLPNGDLWRIWNSTNELSGSQVGPAEVQFSADGRLLAVTEKATNKIDTFRVDNQGRAFGRKTFDSVGVTPFGFSFDNKNRLYVSEAFGGAEGASALSSYATWPNGTISVISPSVPTNQTAACWTAIDSHGNFVYTTNAGSASVSGFKIMNSGNVGLITANGQTGLTPEGSHPIDASITSDDKFLYVLGSGNVGISGFRRKNDGKLSYIGAATGLPASTSGLASW